MSDDEDEDVLSSSPVDQWDWNSEIERELEKEDAESEAKEEALLADLDLDKEFDDTWVSSFLDLRGWDQ